MVCAYLENEKLLYEKFLAKRANGDTVRRARFRIASHLHFKEAYPMLDRHQFRFSAGWFVAFPLWFDKLVGNVSIFVS